MAITFFLLGWLLVKLLNPTGHHMHQNQKENMHGWIFLNPSVFIGLLVFFMYMMMTFEYNFFHFNALYINAWVDACRVRAEAP